MDRKPVTFPETVSSVQPVKHDLLGRKTCTFYYFNASYIDILKSSRIMQHYISPLSVSNKHNRGLAKN